MDTITTTATTSETQTVDRSKFLRRTMQGNALFSTASGLLLLFGSGAVAAFSGLGDVAANILMALGLGLFAWAALTFWVSTRSPMQRLQVMEIIGGDLLWVAASIVLLLGGWLPLSTAGMWTVGVVADIVAVFAILQYVGWRRVNTADE